MTDLGPLPDPVSIDPLPDRIVNVLRTGGSPDLVELSFDLRALGPSVQHALDELVIIGDVVAFSSELDPDTTLYRLPKRRDVRRRERGIERELDGLLGRG